MQSRVFRISKKKLGDEAWSKEQIDDLPQWVELRKQLDELDELLAKGKPDWEDVLDREKRVNQVLGNARYRISPASRSMRSLPVVHPDARVLYEAKLKDFQDRADALHEKAVLKIDPLLSVVPPGKVADRDPPSEVTIYRAEMAVGAYEREIANAEKLTDFPVDRLKTNSIDAGTKYPEYVDDHKPYAESLRKVELLEGMMLSALERAREVNAELLSRPECTLEGGRIHSLNERARAAQTRRLEKGVWFVAEAKAQVQSIRATETAEMAAKLGEKGVIALNFGEKIAIHEANLPIRTGGTITDRLNAIPQLARRGPDGYMVGVYRYTGFRTKPGDNILMGDLGYKIKTVHIESDAAYNDEAYIPINDEAVRFWALTQFGGGADVERLGPITLDDDDEKHLERIKYEDLRP